MTSFSATNSMPSRANNRPIARRNPNQDPRMTAASHLNASFKEIDGLVSTHPTERREIGKAARELKELSSQLLFGGQWPEQTAPVEAPDFGTQMGGTTKSEDLASRHLVGFYNIAVHYTGDNLSRSSLVEAMHGVQNLMMTRIVRRDYPGTYNVIPGSLEADAKREEQRWGT